VNNDEKCFLWSVLASLYPVQLIPERVEHCVQYEHELNMNDIEYPVPLLKINKFEKQNQISVNVFGCEDKEIYPLYVTKTRGSNHHVNLLYLKEGKKSHYCLIKKLNAFLHRTKSHRRETHYCSYCLQGFTRVDLLENNIQYCSKHDPQKLELPKEENNFLNLKTLKSN